MTQVLTQVRTQVKTQERTQREGGLKRLGAREDIKPNLKHQVRTPIAKAIYGEQYINGGLEADLNYTTMYDRLIRSEHKAGKNMLVAKMYQR